MNLPLGPYPDVVTVGATDHAGAVAAFSSRGPGGKPDLVAPGVRIRSALSGGGYGEMSGMSMATPQVAGVVALMWSAAPGAADLHDDAGDVPGGKRPGGGPRRVGSGLEAKPG